jgi:hypothetical protein
MPEPPAFYNTAPSSISRRQGGQGQPEISPERRKLFTVIEGGKS